MNAPPNLGVGLGLGQGTVGTSQATSAQRQRNLLQRLDADIASLVDNFNNMIKAAKINDAVRNNQEAFQIEVHAARVVNAAESLLKLVSELKQNAVFADFATPNSSVEINDKRFLRKVMIVNQFIDMIGQQADDAMNNLEAHYYSSDHKIDPKL